VSAGIPDDVQWEEGPPVGTVAGYVRAARSRVRLSSNDPVRYLVCSSLAVLTVVSLGLAFGIVVLSRLQERSAQTLAFDRLRNQLAIGVAPLGQVDQRGRLLRLGTPMAMLDIPTLGVHQAVLEGTTSGVLMSGPGHLRDTVLPGEGGTSVIFGRAAAYGGPFRGLNRLDVGATIKVTTGVGTTTFKVIDRRRAGDPLPPALASGGVRLTLVTATGFAFLPSGVLRVDADAVGSPQPAPQLQLTWVPHDEVAMASESGTPWGLLVLLQLVILMSAAAAWSSQRWGAARTWIVFAPVLALVAYHLSGQVARLLPNLM
jgi:sortase A